MIKPLDTLPKLLSLELNLYHLMSVSDSWTTRALQVEYMNHGCNNIRWRWETRIQFSIYFKLLPLANDQSLWLIPCSNTLLISFLSFVSKFFILATLSLITTLSPNMPLYRIYRTKNVEDFKSYKPAFNNNQHIFS